MKKTLALLALASALPLAAQSFEAGALYTWNPTKDQTLSVGSNSVGYKADTWKAAGLRFGYNFVSVGPMEFQGNATIQFNNTQDIAIKQNGAPVSTAGYVFNEEYKYWAVGAAVNWNFLMRLGVGLEYRSEQLHLNDSSDGYYHSTTYGRPWIRGTAGFSIPAPVVKPFIGAEVAFPLTTKTLNLSDVTPPVNLDNFNKSLAPKAQYGIYAGIRF